MGKIFLLMIAVFFCHALLFVAHGQTKQLDAGSFKLQASAVDAEQNEAFCLSGEMPEYPGGEDSLYAYLQRTLYYPTTAQKDDIGGLVMTAFVVDTSGLVTLVKNMKSIRGDVDSVCITVLSSMPKWKPGSIFGKPIRVQFVLPVNFILSSHKLFTLQGLTLNAGTSEAVPFVLVNLEGMGKNEMQYSDFDGVFLFKNLPVGQYRLSGQYFHFFSFDTTVVVDNNVSGFVIPQVRDSSLGEYYLYPAHYTAKGATEDIENGTMQIVIRNTFSYDYSISNADSIFEVKYKVDFIFYDCETHSDTDYYAYNRVIFDYLDKTYGKKWRKKIRKDVYGLKRRK